MIVHCLKTQVDQVVQEGLEALVVQQHQNRVYLPDQRHQRRMHPVLPADQGDLEDPEDQVDQAARVDPGVLVDQQLLNLVCQPNQPNRPIPQVLLVDQEVLVVLEALKVLEALMVQEVQEDPEDLEGQGVLEDRADPADLADQVEEL